MMTRTSTIFIAWIVQAMSKILVIFNIYERRLIRSFNFCTAINAIKCYIPVPKHRPMDKMAIGLDLPQEDELAVNVVIHDYPHLDVLMS